METDVEWRTISEFPNYEINARGEVYNSRTHQLMRSSVTNHGHVKITLMTREPDEDGVMINVRYTRSVALLVAEAFVTPPNALCDCVIVLDGVLTNVRADNLAWRPRGFAWSYVRQLRTDQPRHYSNLRVVNITDNIEYESIIHASMVEGLLFNDVWRSTYSGSHVFPYGCVFEISERV